MNNILDRCIDKYSDGLYFNDLVDSDFQQQFEMIISQNLDFCYLSDGVLYKNGCKYSIHLGYGATQHPSDLYIETDEHAILFREFLKPIEQILSEILIFTFSDI